MVVFRSAALHSCVLLALVALFFVLPAYHVGAFSRIMVLAIYAIGYNLLFGYTGLLSLGHAMFFAAGMYGFGLSMNFGGLTVLPAFAVGVTAAGLLSVAVGFLALRTIGVAFMIVTLMFAQTFYLVILYFGEYTRGDEGFIIQQAQRSIAGIDLTTETARYFTAFILFAICFLAMARLVQSPFGKRLVAIRENEERARMLGYDVGRLKLAALVVSGLFSGVAGAAYAMLFGYVGASFAAVHYSIFPLLWVLLGGAGTTVGPLIGVIFMFYLIDVSSSFTNAYMLVAGIALVLLTLFAPQGIAGTLRKRAVSWLP
ncbi:MULTISPECIES: branched-chain amino acid ABC transporter permease [unclassified Ruegeria]|uniref:branched-chain amino acid ABC transporter permease n=1 Tax=unclassified Ruegeria TaxID=2625375 RepID=UPI0014894F18|nr:MULTISPECIES: branched-chain amino acid ABC transporter permease [unclassified Ruegeria]NOD35799.1 branched-chain amino acid ABC transporter permease [Ruegeria sp. HKCCD7296]NOD47735.1 branched-chain amino acid ABC transporter permease [Ruegeria sp. HKCCD5849]NOD52602.1 branched-chain amino acid ABC transporter permease [Ruegeria sp. HKCCD5851]NOD66021.1 branched-chain amino acid ABC transporter permease [Ruegeria sp. HKCCD7303]NOE34364.1 branched-chain amino acid ABC transporter permease [